MMMLVSIFAFVLLAENCNSALQNQSWDLKPMLALIFSGILVVIGSPGIWGLIQRRNERRQSERKSKFENWKNKFINDASKILDELDESLRQLKYVQLLRILPESMRTNISKEYEKKGFSSEISGIQYTVDVYEVCDKKFEDAYEHWKEKMDVPNPNISIVVRSDIKKPEYEKDTEKKLMEIIGKRFKNWGKNKNNLSILVIGANQKSFLESVLREIVKKTKKNLTVWFDSNTSKEEVSHFVRIFNDDNNRGNYDHVTIQVATVQNGDYDIIIHTHWFQHQAPKKFDEIFKRQKLRKGGVLVWLSASSRSNAVEEYVGECWRPKKVGQIIHDHNNQDGLAIRFIDLNNPSDISYIMYDTEEYAAPYGDNDNPIVGRLVEDMGCPWIPATFIVKEFKDNDEDIKRTMEDCLAVATNKKYQVKIIKKIVLGRVEESGCSCCYIVRIIADTNDSAYFIVTKGKESYCFSFDERRFISTTVLTFYPSFEPFNSSQAKDVLDEAIIKRVIDMHSPALQLNDDRYEQYCNNKNCHIPKSKFFSQLLSRVGFREKNLEAAIWHVFTSLKDVVLEDLFICAVKTKKGVDYYCTILPKKQYFTVNEFNDRLQKMAAFRKTVNITQNEFPCPYMLWSLTHLETYDNMETKLRKELGVTIESDSVWFHKCFGALKDDDLNGMTEQEKAESKKHPVLFDGKVKEVSLDGSVKEVAYDASVEKDAAFNELPLPARLKLLGSIAAHDVLFFGIKEADAI